MTLEEFSRDIVPILQLIITTLGLFSLVLLWRQARDSGRWSKLQAHRAFGSTEAPNLKQLRRCAHRIGVDLKARTEPLSEEETQKIWEDFDSYEALIDYFNSLESVSAQIQAGIIDSDAAFSTYGLTITGAFRLFRPLIDRLRTVYGDDAFVEWEKLAEKWFVVKEQAKDKKEQEKKQALQGKGISKKF